MADDTEVPLPKPDPRTAEVVFNAIQAHEKDVGKPMEKWSIKDFTKFQNKFGVTAGKIQSGGMTDDENEMIRQGDVIGAQQTQDENAGRGWYK